MTAQLAEISARITAVRQLGTVVNAMKGIAAGRARIARMQVKAVDGHAATISSAMAHALGPDISMVQARSMSGSGKPGLLVFCAEQGFAGAFSERVIDSIGPELDPDRMFLIGTRGLSIAAARGIVPAWTTAMPSHSPGIPKLADRITTAIFAMVGTERIDRLDVVFTGSDRGRQTIKRQSLFPVDMSHFPKATGERPLMQVPIDGLIDSLGREYLHALICKAALHAFAAENEARMDAMSAAGSQIARELETFQALLRQVRQEDITAEIIELGTGAKNAQGI
ncbi:MAG: F0F1 ATP synthase subunit gamma [Paracoccaceae bacterium]|nr:F0F1 ATP synthase subunit gamma [Paracoccaceae bacterium]